MTHNNIKKIIYEINLHGIYTFWVASSLSVEDVEFIITNHERERGKYGFRRIKSKDQRQVILDFIAKNPQLELKYITWIQLELHKRMMTTKWLHFMLLRSGVHVDYQTVSRWVRGSAVPKAVLQKKLRQVFLVN